MNTTTKITVGLFTVLSLGMLAGCEAPRSVEEMNNDEELAAEEPIGEAQEALVAGIKEVAPPLLSNGTLYRIRIMEPTAGATKCLDLPTKPPITLGEPLVRTECNGQQLDNSTNTQAFYFVRVQVTGHPEITDRYNIKPAHVPLGSELCMYSAGPSMDNGGNVVVGQCSSADSRQLNLRAFELDPLPNPRQPWDNFMTLSFQHSGRCMTVTGSWEGDFVAITQYGTTSTTYCEGLYNSQRLQILTN